LTSSATKSNHDARIVAPVKRLCRLFPQCDHFVEQLLHKSRGFSKRPAGGPIRRSRIAFGDFGIAAATR
jgi:hypothetical protein